MFTVCKPVSKLAKAAIALTTAAFLAACEPGGVGGGPSIDTSNPVPVALLVPRSGDAALAQHPAQPGGARPHAFAKGRAYRGATGAGTHGQCRHAPTPARRTGPGCRSGPAADCSSSSSSGSGGGRPARRSRQTGPAWPDSCPARGARHPAASCGTGRPDPDGFGPDDRIRPTHWPKRPAPTHCATGATGQS